MKFAAVFLALIPLAFGGMAKVWEVRLGNLVKEPAGWEEDKNHPITALAFSPEGKQLAVAIDSHYLPTSATELTHILILNPTNPKDQIRQFDVQTCAEPLTWAPSSEAILLCGVIVRIADGKSCDALPALAQSVRSGVSPSFTLWIDSMHLLRGGVILDTDCVQTGTWAPVGRAKFTPGKWGIADIAPEKGCVLVWHTVGVRPNEFTEYGIADSKSGEWIGKPGAKHAHVGQGILMPVESAWCGLDGKQPRCWNVLDGKEIRLGHGIGGYQFTNPAAAAPRVIAEHWAYPSFFACFSLCPSELQRRGVWDFSARTLVSSWMPNVQAWNSIHRLHEPYRCAISPDGKFVAEGGDGVVRLYRLTS